ncbi:MAG: pyridoxamine 5'-phosphate oxidase family protein [Proteobacteria bacterium]|nr:pyridoxamine 5'-phosphate oxidase family protein [Pseudomonadota bacterium]
MRRKFNEITDKKDIEAILLGARIGRLATLGQDGYPYITPVNFVFFRGAIYFHCARQGEKLDNLRRDPKVCFAVDRPLAYLDTGYDKNMPVCDVGQFYQSVVIRGRAEIIFDVAEKVEALNALMACHENAPEFALITATTTAVELCTVVAVRVESISAKANLAQKKSAADKEKICTYLQQRDLPGDKETADFIG